MEGREVLPDLMELCTLLHHDFWNPVLCPSLSAQHLPQPRLEGSFCLELGLWPVSHRTSHKTPKWAQEVSQEGVQRPKTPHASLLTNHVQDPIQCQALRSNS